MKTNVAFLKKQINSRLKNIIEEIRLDEFKNNQQLFINLIESLLSFYQTRYIHDFYDALLLIDELPSLFDIYFDYLENDLKLSNDEIVEEAIHFSRKIIKYFSKLIPESILSKLKQTPITFLFKKQSVNVNFDYTRYEYKYEYSKAMGSDNNKNGDKDIIIIKDKDTPLVTFRLLESNKKVKFKIVQKSDKIKVKIDNKPMEDDAEIEFTNKLEVIIYE